MLRRATALKRICDRQRVQNAYNQRGKDMQKFKYVKYAFFIKCLRICGEK